MKTKQQKIREKWVKALRSGKYKQGSAGLCHTNGEHCCLGVLAEVLGLVKLQPQPDGSLYRFGVQKAAFLPSKEIMAAVGLSSQHGVFTPGDARSKLLDKLQELGIEHDEVDFCLTELNDSGVPFSVIADIIEAEPEGLFISQETA